MVNEVEQSSTPIVGYVPLINISPSSDKFKYRSTPYPANKAGFTSGAGTTAIVSPTSKLKSSCVYKGLAALGQLAVTLYVFAGSSTSVISLTTYVYSK